MIVLSDGAVRRNEGMLYFSLIGSPSRNPVSCPMTFQCISAVVRCFWVGHQNSIALLACCSDKYLRETFKEGVSVLARRWRVQSILVRNA